MADIVEKITFDDSGAIKSLMNIDAQMDKLNAKIRTTEMSYEEAFVVAKDAMDGGAKAVEAGTKAIGSHIVETNKAKTAALGYKGALRELADSVNVMGVNLGGVINNLQSKAAAMKTVVTGLSAGTNALKLFKVALASTGIGLIVVALGALVAMFNRSEKVIDKTEQALAAFGAVINVIIDRASKLGEAIVKIFSGDFKGALNDGKQAFSGLTAEMVKQGTAAAKLQKHIQDLEDVNRAVILQNEVSKGQIATLLNLAADQNKSLDVRIAALEEVKRLEIEIADRAIKKAFDDFEIERARFNARKTHTDAELDAYNAAVAGALAAENLKDEVQRTSIKRISGLKEQERAKDAEAYNTEQARIAAINKAYEDQLNKLLDASDKLHDASLDQEGQLRAEANLVKLVINEQFRLLDVAAQAAGKQVDLTEEKAALILAVETKLARDIEVLLNSQIPKLGETIIKPLKVAERTAVDVVGNVQGALEGMDSPKLDNVFDSIQGKLENVFNLDWKEIKEQFASIGQSLSIIFSAGVDAAIEENDRLIDELQERKDQSEEDLEKELERQEAGLANSVDLKRTEIEELKKQEEQALKEREKLRKKELAAKLIADSIQQGSNLIVMASEVVRAESGKGLLGIAFAAAAIAAFLGIFNQIKNANKAKAFKGGAIDRMDTVTGFVNKSGRTDRHGGRGHAVEDSNLVLGGKEFVVNEQGSQLHADFLAHLNAGRFDDRDLIKELQSSVHNPAYMDRFTKNVEHRNEIISAHASRSDKEFQVRAMDAVFGKHIDRLMASGGSNGSFYVIPKGGGTVVYVDEKGNKKIIESL